MKNLLEYLKGVKVVNKANAIMVTRDIGSYQEYTLYVSKENAERLIRDTKNLLFRCSSSKVANLDVSNIMRSYVDKLGHTPNDYDKTYVKIKLFRDNWYFDVIGDWKFRREVDDHDLYDIQEFNKISWKDFKEYAIKSDVIKNPVSK